MAGIRRAFELSPLPYFEKLFSAGYSDSLVLGEKGNINAKLVQSNGFHFDGATDFTITNQSIGTVHTIHFCCKMDSSTWQAGSIIGGLGGTNYSYVGFIAGSNPSVNYLICDTSGNEIYSASFLLSSYPYASYGIDWVNDWLEVDLIRDGVSLKLRVNGVLLEEKTNATGTFTFGRIGNRNSFAYRLTNVSLHDLRIYTAVKTLAQIQSFDQTDLVFDIPFSNGYGNPTEVQQGLVLTKASGNNTYATQDKYHRNLLHGCTKVVIDGNTTYYPYKLDGTVRYTPVGGETSIIQIEKKVGFGPVETKVEIPIEDTLVALDALATVLYNSGAVKQFTWQNFRDMTNDYIKCNITDSIYVKDLYLPFSNVSQATLNKISSLTQTVTANVDNSALNLLIYFQPFRPWDKYESNPVLSHGTDLQDEDNNQVFHPILFKDGDTHIMFYAVVQYPANHNRPGIAITADNTLQTWTKNIVNGYVKAVMYEGVEGEYDSQNCDPWSVVKEETTYKLWYRSDNYYGGQHRNRVGYATSPDGYTWTKGNTNNGCIYENFTKSVNGLNQFCCIGKHNGFYWAYISHQYAGGIDLIKSADGITNWTLVKENILGNAVGHYPRVFKIKNRIYIFYCPTSSINTIRLASSYAIEGNFYDRGMQLVKSGIERANCEVCLNPDNNKLLYGMYVPEVGQYSYVDIGLTNINYENLLKY